MLSLVIICSVLFILSAEAWVTGNELVTITANSRNLTYVTTNQSDKYHGEANYTYVDGEELQFVCSKAGFFHLYFFDVFDTLRLEYYDVEGNLLFKTKARKQTEHTFRSVLTSINNKYYLDCILWRDDPKKEHRYRTIFYLMERHLDAADHAMILSVNDQDLTAIRNNNEPSYDDYVFRCIGGEVLLVTCRKTDNYMPGTITFTYIDKSRRTSKIPNKYGQQVLRRPSELSLNVSSSNMLSIKHLTCSIDNSDVPKPNARILFESEVPENDVRIRGLPKNNILYQYTNDEKQWTIEYQYVLNETLNLTCVAKGPINFEKQRLLWRINGKLSMTATTLLSTTAIVSKHPLTITLKTTDNGKKIGCIYNPHTFLKEVEIILRLKPEPNSGEIISTKTQSDANINQDKAGENSLLILGSSIGAVLVVLGMTGVACRCILLMRSKNNRRNVETSYGDLTNNNDNPEPQNPDKYENQYESCYAENQPGIYYEIPANVENIDPEEHYTEIDISRFKPKIDERKTRNNLVYDEPYIHSTMKSTMNTLYRV